MSCGLRYSRHSKKQNYGSLPHIDVNSGQFPWKARELPGPKARAVGWVEHRETHRNDRRRSVSLRSTHPTRLRGLNHVNGSMH
jgi:hypothetical protein